MAAGDSDGDSEWAQGMDGGRMGAAQQGPLSCPPQLWPRPGLVQSCSHLNCTCCPHPMLSSGQAGGCAAPPMHPEAHGHLRAGEATPGTRCWGTAGGGDRRGARDPAKGAFVPGFMPISGGPPAPCRHAGHGLTRQRLSGQKDRGRRSQPSSSIDARCRLIVKSLIQTMGSR